MSIKIFSYSSGEIQINTDSREIVIITRSILGSGNTMVIPFNDIHDFRREYGLLDSPERGGGSLLLIVTKSLRTFKIPFNSGAQCKQCSDELWNILP